jgi:nicotinate-nucleotide--dimethylbenzimidazole phosphoribosyltransferase
MLRPSADHPPLVRDRLLQQVLDGIESPDAAWLAQARSHLDCLTKPIGSLGRLEDIAAKIASIQRAASLDVGRKAVYVFAADHGITEEGVSAYPREVTRQMVLNFLGGGAAINVISRQAGAEVVIVDVGVDADFASAPGMLHRKVRPGTRNMLRAAAMDESEMLKALHTGIELADQAQRQRTNVIAVGEMGIGNTTAASAITAALTGAAPSLVTGAGTGIAGAALEHKRAIIEAVLARHQLNRQGSPCDPLETLSSVGGFEIAAMVGMILGCARHRILIVVDGFIATSAAAIACALMPTVGDCLFAGHESMEPGHRILLEYLKLEPILRLKMRLGEGTGAVLAFHVIEAAARIYNEMATFASAQVSTAKA